MRNYTIVEHLLKTARHSIPIMVHEKNENDILLKIPFSADTYFNESANLLEGRDFVTNEKISFDKDKIVGFSYWENDNLEDFNSTMKVVKAKIDVFNRVTNDLKCVYSHDKKFVIYSEYLKSNMDNSLALVPFNLIDTKQLNSSDGIEEHRNSFRNVLVKAAEKAKETISAEAKEWIDSSDTSSLEELNAIKEIIDEAVVSSDLSVYNTPIELINSGWPVLLAPNPFVLTI